MQNIQSIKHKRLLRVFPGLFLGVFKYDVKEKEREREKIRKEDLRRIRNEHVGNINSATIQFDSSTK